MSDDKPAELAAELPPAPPKPEPEQPPKPDEKPKRPTTRAGRRAASEAAKAKRSSSSSSDKSKPKSSTRQPKLETRVAGSLTNVGLMVAAMGAGTGSAALQADGVAIIEHSPGIAAALDKVAAENPAVRAALERALTVGTWGALIGALTPLAITIAANHGAIPAGLAGLLGAGADQAQQQQPAGAPFGVPVG